MRCVRSICAACVLLTICLAALRGEEEPEEAKSAAAEWIAQRQEAFGTYTFQMGDEGMPLVLESRSILNWSNAERRAAKGGVFLWTYNGQPQLIACAFMNKTSVQHEFQSLADQPVVAARSSRQVHRFDPGIEWLPLKDAPAPAKRPALRLSQFRRQAERFAISFGNKEWTPARLLTRPVFVSEDHNVALFLFVQGTDPECTLLLSIKDDETWHYALARQTTFGLKAELDETVVWERMPTWAAKTDTSYAVLTE
jgi:hypothetical protein